MTFFNNFFTGHFQEQSRSGITGISFKMLKVIYFQASIMYSRGKPVVCRQNAGAACNDPRPNYQAIQAVNSSKYKKNKNCTSSRDTSTANIQTLQLLLCNLILLYFLYKNGLSQVLHSIYVGLLFTLSHLLLLVVYLEYDRPCTTENNCTGHNSQTEQNTKHNFL